MRLARCRHRPYDTAADGFSFRAMDAAGFAETSEEQKNRRITEQAMQEGL